MNDLINKISSYNLFNHLLPGAIFVVFVEYSTHYKILQENMIVNVFLVYFIGLVISRVGSLVIEYPLKKIAPHEEYSSFIDACAKDKKIETLYEANNMYRTFISLFTILLVFQLCDSFCEWIKNYTFYILVLLLLVLFIAAYVKQAKYIGKRVKHQCKKEEK